MQAFDIRNWYWLIGNDIDRVFSSERASYIPVDDAAYTSWLARGNFPTPTDTEEELIAYLAPRLPDLVLLFPRGLLAYAPIARWRKETGGIVVGGVPVATDDRSKQMILGARLAAEADSGFTTPWVGSDGSINTLNAAQVIAISDAVLAHVAGCFATFAAIKADIDTGDITTREEIDAAFAA